MSKLKKIYEDEAGNKLYKKYIKSRVCRYSYVTKLGSILLKIEKEG